MIAAPGCLRSRHSNVSALRPGSTSIRSPVLASVRTVAYRWRRLSAWPVDRNAGGPALWIALLTAHGQQIIYVPGRTGHPAPSSCRGDGKTDAKAAFVIADQARMRRDLQPLQERDEIAVDLRILTARRYDLSADRTRAINRLRAQLLEYFPALERAFDCIRLDDPPRKSLSPCDCEDAVGDRR